MSSGSPVRRTRWSIVGRAAPPDRRASTVGLDDCHGGDIATRHLLEVHGARRIAHISGPLGHQSAQDKLAGYRAALVAAAIAPDPLLEVEGDYSDGGGYEAVQELFRRNAAFEAIFAANDQMALGAGEALRARGLAVPDDVLLVGYDDIPLARYASPALTSVQGDMAAVGALAATRLLSLVDGHPAPRPPRCSRPASSCAGHAAARRTPRGKASRAAANSQSINSTARRKGNRHDQNQGGCGVRGAVRRGRRQTG